LRHLKILLASLLAALALAACGPAASLSWPGLGTDGKLIYLAQGQQVHAVNADTGLELWNFPITPNNDTGQFAAEPGISATTIVVGSEGAANSYSGILYGLDPATGQQKWCLAFDPRGTSKQPNCKLAQAEPVPNILGQPLGLDNRILGGITLTDSVAYVGLVSGAVYAVNAETGADLWHFKAERDVWGAPLVAANTVYIPSLDHFVYAVDRQTGRLQWKKDMGAAVAGSPSLSGDTLYVSSFANQLVALDAGTGAERWSVDATNWVWSGPAISQGVLYFTDVSGTVFAVNSESHQIIWSVKPGGPMRARPVLAFENLYVGDRSGNLFALDPATGATRPGWPQVIKGELLVPPVIAGSLVIVAPFGGDNLLVAYTPAGQFKWPFAPSK
jgi:outer membrane protein assembly factor BamB